jgi:hypothetical protein
LKGSQDNFAHCTGIIGNENACHGYLIRG